jgi:hypothetical protein
VGGCCGVGPEHVAAAREVLEDPKAGNKREVELPSDVGESVEFATPVAEPWTDAHGRAPDDPFEQVSTHRPLDYWGGNLIDHLISLLPDALADDGVAYILQLSIIGQQRTAEQLRALGYQSRVVDYGFFEFHEPLANKSPQITRVEELSDAYHLNLGDRDVMVDYLVEVTGAPGRPRSRRSPP